MTSLFASRFNVIRRGIHAISLLPRGLASWGPVKPVAEEPKVSKRVLKCIRNLDKLSSIEIPYDAHFNKDLGLDSLDQVEILMAVEDEFRMDLDTSLVETLTSVQAITRYLVDWHNNSDLDLQLSPPTKFEPGYRPPNIAEEPEY